MIINDENSSYGRKFFFWLVTTALLFYYQCRCGCGAQLTDQELDMFINQQNCLLIRLLAQPSRHPPPRLLIMHYVHIAVRTVHCGIHLNATYSDRILDLSERPIPVKVLT